MATTRWLSIEEAVTRVLNKWSEMKEHFKLTGTNEKCFIKCLQINITNSTSHFKYQFSLKLPQLTITT